MATVELKEQPRKARRAIKEARFPYLPGLDGLRALAVIAVLLYHADLQWIPGGFLGVEVFFVISGYLITGLLLAEWRSHGHIDLKAFWLRRARRLLPALYLLLGVTMLYAAVFLYNEVASLRGDVLAALAYVTNWYLIFTEKSYFEAVGRPSLLRHLWSLAVEEQFYLFWPILIALGMSVWRRRWVLTAILAGAAASTLWMAYLYQPNIDPSRVYYGTDTRAAGFLIGCALAFVWAPDTLRATVKGYTTRDKALVQGMGVAALVALLALFSFATEYSPFLYYGGFALVALVTAALIAAVAHPAAGWLSAALGWGILRWIGLRSYGIYLWHWPVYMVTRPQLDMMLEGLPLLGLRVGVTVVLAELSYRLVETPIRHGALGRNWNRLRASTGRERTALALRWTGAVGALVVLVVALTIALVRAPEPAPPEYLQVQSIDTGLNPILPPVAEAAGSPLPEGVSDAAAPAVSGSPASPPLVTSASAAPADTTWTAPPQLAHEQPQATDAPLSLTAPESPWDIAPPPDVKALPSTVEARARGEVSLRERPDDLANTVRGLPARAAVTIDGKSDDGVWYRVQAEGESQGWLPGDDLQAAAPTLHVPIVASATGTTRLQSGDSVQASAPPAPQAAAPSPPPASLALVPPSVRVSAIGDSVMLGAAAAMQAGIPGARIDAAVSRQTGNAVDIVRSWRDSGQLAPTVVVHMGNNGTFNAAQFDQLMEAVGDRRIIFVNVKVPRPWQAPNNRVIAEGVSRYPNATLVDWLSASADRPDLFWQDGIHLRPEGAQMYTRLVADALLGR